MGLIELGMLAALVLLGVIVIFQQVKISELDDTLNAVKDLAGLAFTDTCKNNNRIQEVSIFQRAHKLEWQKHLLTTFQHIDNGRGTPTPVKHQYPPEYELVLYKEQEVLREDAKRHGIKLQFQPWDLTSKRWFRDMKKQKEQEGNPNWPEVPPEEPKE